jgi:hypothetical protein
VFASPLRIFAPPLKSHAPPLEKVSMIDQSENLIFFDCLIKVYTSKESFSVKLKQ